MLNECLGLLFPTCPFPPTFLNDLLLTGNRIESGSLPGLQRARDRFYAKRNYDRAVSDFNKSLELDLRFAIAYANRGLTYYATQNYDNALANTSESIELGKRNLLAFSVRGDAYYAKQDYDHALADYTSAIHLLPYQSCKLKPLRAVNS